MSNATKINNAAYRALVQASNAAHRNAGRAMMEVKVIETQIAHLKLALVAARDAERMAKYQAAAIDAGIAGTMRGLMRQSQKIEANA